MNILDNALKGFKVFPRRSKKEPIPYNERMPLYCFNGTTGWWGIPNIEKDIAFEGPEGPIVTIRHNSEGNRDKPFRPDHSERCILCFGGSHTWGAFVEQDLRYTDRLSVQTKKRFVNIGHGSFGLDQICITILKKARDYSPNLIIVEQYPWAIHRVVNTYIYKYLKPYFYLDSKGELRLQKLPWVARFQLYRNIIGSYRLYKKELREFQNGIDLKGGYDPHADPIFLYWKSHYYDYMYSLVDKILVVMKDHCAQIDCKLTFVLVAYHQQFAPRSVSSLIDYDLPAKRFKALLEKNGIPYVDAVPELLKAHSAEDPVIAHDGHTNAKGHGIIAELLRAELEKRGWI